MRKKTNTKHSTGYCKAYPSQIDNVTMCGDYEATASNVRSFLTQRLEELGEKPYINGKGTLMCKLHNEDGTQHLMITQRGHSVWVRGSLSKWGGCKDEYQRYSLQRERTGVVIRVVLDMLGLDHEWVKVHSVEMGIDILVSGSITDYTPYLRIAPRQKRMHVPNERTTHYQGSSRKLFKVYDKGAEMKIKTPDGTTLLRLELGLSGGAKDIGRMLGLLLPLHASDLGKEETLLSIIRLLHDMIRNVLPTGIAKTTGKPKDKAIETAISMLIDQLGDNAVPMLVERMEAEAEAEANKKSKHDIKRYAQKVSELYGNVDSERFRMIRDEIAGADGL